MKRQKKKKKKKKKKRKKMGFLFTAVHICVVT